MTSQSPDRSGKDPAVATWSSGTCRVGGKKKGPDAAITVIALVKVLNRTRGRRQYTRMKGRYGGDYNGIDSFAWLP